MIIIVAYVFAIISGALLFMLSVLGASAFMGLWRRVSFCQSYQQRKVQSYGYSDELRESLIGNYVKDAEKEYQKKRKLSETATDAEVWNDINEDFNQEYETKFEGMAKDIVWKVNGFQCLSELVGLLPRSGTMAFRLRKFHRLFAILTCLLLPINLAIFEFTSSDFDCLTEGNLNTLHNCTEHPPRQVMDLPGRIWSEFGLLLPLGLVIVFYLVQDGVVTPKDKIKLKERKRKRKLKKLKKMASKSKYRRESMKVSALDFDTDESSWDISKTDLKSTYDPQAAECDDDNDFDTDDDNDDEDDDDDIGVDDIQTEIEGIISEETIIAQESYLMRILKLASKEDQLELSRSMDKWTSIALWCIGFVILLTVVSLTFEIIKVLRNEVNHGETVFLVIVVQMQALYILAAMITLLLHIRTFRKVLLLDIRRGFEKVSDSILFKWMRRTGKSPFKRYADNFLPHVLSPFSSSLQWVTWLSVFMVSLIIISVMIQTLTPFKQVHNFGEYEATFFLSLAIVVGFVYKAYSHLQDSIENLTDVEDMNLLAHEDGIEPLLILGDSLGFKHANQIRKAVEFFEKHNGPINKFFGDAKQLRSGVDAVRLASSVVQNTMKDEDLNRQITQRLGSATVDRVKRTVLTVLDDKEKLAKKLQILPGMNPQLAIQMATFAEGVGLVKVENESRLDQLQQLYGGLKDIKTIIQQTRKFEGPLVAKAVDKVVPYISDAGDSEAIAKSMIKSVEMWVQLQGITDVSVAMEFAQVILPRFQQRDLEIDDVAKFLKERLQVSDAIKETLLNGIQALVPSSMKLEQLAQRFSTLKGLKQESALQLAKFADGVGLSDVDGVKKLTLLKKVSDRLASIQSTLQASTDGVALASASHRALVVANISELVDTWAQLRGIERDVVAEFTNTVLPRLQNRDINMDEVSVFLRERLNTNDFMTTTLMSVLRPLSSSSSSSSLSSQPRLRSPSTSPAS